MTPKYGKYPLADRDDINFNVWKASMSLNMSIMTATLEVYS